MNDDTNRGYTVEFEAGEADQIEQSAVKQGISASDFITYCARAVCFGINYAVEKLAETGQVGTGEDSKGIK